MRSAYFKGICGYQAQEQACAFCTWTCSLQCIKLVLTRDCSGCLLLCLPAPGPGSGPSSKPALTAPVTVHDSCTIYSPAEGTLRVCFLFCIAGLQESRCLPCSPHVPPASLEGLTEFSHCWVLYVFHCNTDLHKLWQRDQRQGKALVRVPRLNGEGRGTLATRTPHRPLPIGSACLQILISSTCKWALCLTGS